MDISRARSSPRMATYLLPLSVYVMATYLAWQGFGYWDSVHYVNAALDLLENGPSIGEKHWDLRYPLVLPITASFALLGTNEFAATLPSIVYGACLVLVSTGFGMRHLGTFAGMLLGLLIATSVSLTLLPLGIEIRGPEVLFVVLAFWLFVSGTRAAPSSPLLIGAGVAAAFAFLCREVSGYVLPTIVLATLLFLPREQWRAAVLYPAAGFLAVLACEFAFYTIATGDPIYRYRISLMHNEIAGGAAQDLASGLREKGLFETLVTPIARYLGAPSTLPLALFGGFAGLSLLFSLRRLPGTARLALGVFATATVLSYLMGTLVLNLQSPRYFPMLDYLACLTIAVATAAPGLKGWRRLLLIPIVALVAFGPFAADATRGFLFDGARPAAQAAKDEAEPIVATQWFRERAIMLLRLDGWGSAAATAEFAADGEDPGDALFFVFGDEIPCESDEAQCNFDKVRDLGALELSWGQRVRASLCAAVPSLAGHFCNWSPPSTALYRKVGALR